MFPLHERLKGHASVDVRKRLEASQWLRPEQILAEQSARLQSFLKDIGVRVPYYRSLFRELGFDPAAVQSAKDLVNLPLLTKAVIREQGERMKADEHGPLSQSNTGGSSGEPLVFYMGLARKSHDVGSKWRATRWWGVDIGDKEAVIWGSPIEHTGQDRVKMLRDAAFRSTLLPAFEMSDQKLDEYVAWIRDHRPSMLFGYPSALSYIARHARKRSQALDKLGIRVAFVTSERLYDEQREVIQSTFGCPVANGYGGRDAGFIAHQCPSGGMHISAEDIIVEILDPAGQPVSAGTSGEIVVTHLASGDFPFVRYRTGDVASLDSADCACGRGLPMLRDLQGRATDFVVSAEGTVIHGLALIYVLRDLPDIEGFKVTQHTRLRTQVQVVPGSGFQPDVVPKIIDGIKKRLGEQVEVVVELVPAIAPEKSGKYRYIISHALPS
jgi:phenylacetate-CoA ligase